MLVGDPGNARLVQWPANTPRGVKNYNKTNYQTLRCVIEGGKKVAEVCYQKAGETSLVYNVPFAGMSEKEFGDQCASLKRTAKRHEVLSVEISKPTKIYQNLPESAVLQNFKIR